MATEDNNNDGPFSTNTEFYTGIVMPIIYGYKEDISENRRRLNISWSYNTTQDGSIFEFIVLLFNSSQSCLSRVHFICESCPSPYIWTNLNENNKTERTKLVDCSTKKDVHFNKTQNTLNNVFNMEVPLSNYTVLIYAINLCGVHVVYDRNGTSPTNMINLRAYSTDKEIYVTWEIPTMNRMIHHGYVVNVTYPSGRCETTIINMKYHWITVSSHCPYLHTVRWPLLQTFKIENTTANSTYKISVAAVSGEYISTNNIVTLITDRKESTSVSHLRADVVNFTMKIQFSVPRDIPLVTINYKVKVTLITENMCSYGFKILFEDIINTTFVYIKLNTHTNCNEYQIDVTPVSVFPRRNSIGAISSILYKSKMNTSTSLNNVSIDFLSKNLLRVSWSNPIIDDECNNFGIVIESINVDNNNDCGVLIITRRMCTTLIDNLDEELKCKNKEYRYLEAGIINDYFFLHRKFDVAKTYRIKFWRINEKIVLILNTIITNKIRMECFFDCYDSTYTGIRSGSTEGQMCLPWIDRSKERSHRSNICHYADNPSNKPWCLHDENGTIIDCDIPRCNTISKDVACVLNIDVSSSRESIIIKWPQSISKTDVIRGYLILLHNTDHDCLRFHLRTCTNCINLSQMSTHIQGFYVSCQSWFMRNKKNNETILDGLRPNNEYFLYIIPLYNNTYIGQIRNITVATQCSDLQTNIYTRITDRSTTMLQFKWTRFREDIHYYMATLVNTHTNTELITKTSKEIVIFNNLDICTEYCLRLSMVNKGSQSELIDVVCGHTTVQNTGIVSLQQISSGPHLNRTLSWQYFGRDDCPRYYRVKITNKYTNETVNIITNATTIFVDNLKKYMVYIVRIRTEVTVASNISWKNENDMDSQSFFTGDVNPKISIVLCHHDISKTQLECVWKLDKSLIESFFEFVVRVTLSSNTCVQSFNYVCQSCADPHKRKCLNRSWISHWENLLKCEIHSIDTFTRYSRVFDAVIKILERRDNYTMTIYGLNLMGSHKLYDRIL